MGHGEDRGRVARWLEQARQAVAFTGARLVIVNGTPTGLDPQTDLVLHASLGRTLVEIDGQLGRDPHRGPAMWADSVAGAVHQWVGGDPVRRQRRSTSRCARRRGTSSGRSITAAPRCCVAGVYRPCRHDARAHWRWTWT